MDKIPEKPSPVFRNRLESDTQSIAQSEKSLEWFDDEFDADESIQTPRRIAKHSPL